MRNEPIKTAGADDKWIAVCAWCPDAEVQTREWFKRGYKVTHAICPVCTKRMEAMAKVYGEFLEERWAK